MAVRPSATPNLHLVALCAMLDTGECLEDPEAFWRSAGSKRIVLDEIQELFRLERRWSFQRFLELLLTQSGGIFEATRRDRSPLNVSGRNEISFP